MNSVTLTVTTGPLKDRQMTYREKGLVVVGRGTECTVSMSDIADLTVSRRHCLFEIDPPRALVRDLGSLNGTFVNGVCIGGRDATGRPRSGMPAQLTLYHGDLVRVGETCFQVTTIQDYSEPMAYPSEGDLTEVMAGEPEAVGH